MNLEHWFQTKSRNMRLRHYTDVARAAGKLEASLSELDPDSLLAAARKHRSSGANNAESIPMSLALTRAAVQQAVGKRLYDTQLIGASALINNEVAEMMTGEGKTLVAVAASFHKSITGKVHVVTANDYLAQRDATELEAVYAAIGLTVSFITSKSTSDERRAAYESDVLYATAHELGFDYLRDNLASNKDEVIQVEAEHAIIDELDSVLIDDARTPMVISGKGEVNPAEYHTAVHFTANLKVETKKPGKDIKAEPAKTTHVVIDPQRHSVEITETGHEFFETALVEAGIIPDAKYLYTPEGVRWIQLIRTMIIARNFYTRDKDYLINNEGKLQIIDASTGRVMDGRRWSGGIHQSLEALEGLVIGKESHTLASITVQNYFRHYSTLSGMTGTAETDSEELKRVYNLSVCQIPTNRPKLRVDEPDLLFLNDESRFRHVIGDIKSSNKLGQPVLVGTNTVEMSERVAQALDQAGLSYSLLNAKQSKDEAYIIAKAGLPGAITIATNMAGRGTDIMLGGNPEKLIEGLSSPTDEERNAVIEKTKCNSIAVRDSGGLRVIGIGRNTTRRIDNQLIGRSGRQGDPGSTVFYLSMEDELVDKFLGETQKKLMISLGVEENDALEGNLINKQIAFAQKLITSQQREVRMNMLSFDNVLNEQRRVIYSIRKTALFAESKTDLLNTLVERATDIMINESLEGNSGVLSFDDVNENLFKRLRVTIKDLDETAGSETQIRARIKHNIASILQHRNTIFGKDFMEQTAQSIFIESIDTNWRNHLDMMNSLLEGIHLRGYAQKDPKMEYKREAFELFKSMLNGCFTDFVELYFKSTENMIAERLSAEQSTEN